MFLAHFVILYDTISGETGVYNVYDMAHRGGLMCGVCSFISSSDNLYNVHNVYTFSLPWFLTYVKYVHVYWISCFQGIKHTQYVQDGPMFPVDSIFPVICAHLEKIEFNLAERIQ